jgi:hypothetical protein
MRTGAERHDPCVAGGGERVVQAERKREVAEVVGRELQFAPLRSERFRQLWSRHDVRT